MNDILFLLLTNVLNWFGLHIIKVGPHLDERFPVILLIGYAITAFLSFIFFAIQNVKIKKAILIRQPRSIVFVLLWTVSIITIYYLFNYNLIITQSYVFIGQSLAPLLVGIYYTLKSKNKVMRITWLGLLILFLLALEKGGFQLSGSFLQFLLIIVCFLGTQFAVRELLKKHDSAATSFNLALGIALVLFLFCFIDNLLTVNYSIDTLVRGILFGISLTSVQLIFLTIYKRGQIIVTSLSQSSGIIIGLLLDHFVYGTRVTILTSLLSIAYIMVGSLNCLSASKNTQFKAVD